MVKLINSLRQALYRWQIKTGARCACGATATEPYGTKFATCIDCGERRP